MEHVASRNVVDVG